MPPKKTEISSFKHQDKRVNIPPQELSSFLEDEERTPKTMLYPRDPSLDPQLVWKGKDEQDQQDLALPTVPIYIQEKIQPQAIIENVRKHAAKAGNGIAELDAKYLQMNFFDDFNNIQFEDLVEFYEHEQNWTNRMVLGDSLLVMTSLAEKEGLKGKVQMIYMDPPYGIKFGSNWQTRLRKRDVKDGSQDDLTREPEQVKAFRDTWELGIHSYLSYLRDRFTVARELLTESGSIFVQIGDENVHLVRSVLDEVFGSENFIADILFNTTTARTAKYINQIGDFIIWYGKNKDIAKYKQLYISKEGHDKHFTQIDELSRSYYLRDLSSQGVGSNEDFWFRGKVFKPPMGRHWSTNPNRIPDIRLDVQGQYVRAKVYDEDFPVAILSNRWDDTQFGEEKFYVVQTNSLIIQRCMLMTTDPGDLVLDPTCGSGTTAYVAEQWGRRWITIDTSRVSIALARMRLMTARYPYYLLADSFNGFLKEAELRGIIYDLSPDIHSKFKHDLRKGFVYQRVPHITLKSIANNEEIDEIHARWQETLEPLRAQINQALGTRYQEWEMPRLKEEIDSRSRNDELLEKWWEARRQRQAEIDASIARRADVELLYDKPYEESKSIRVCGPFTVESLSPHRVLSTDIERPESEKEAEKLEGGGKFEQTIIDNLRTSGVQNTRKSERLTFTSLDTFAGTYLQASGEYLESGASKRVTVCIGPEHGTVGTDLIKEAAKEAMQGIGFDLLVVLGFAFDPHISEEVKNYGRLKILPARINPDLMMGDLLKKTQNAQLFTTYGEPDIEVTRHGDKLVVRLRGVDIFDPTTGEIRSSKPEEIACWFIDDDYNGESFFVRQAYFTGWDEPYEKLRRALRSEVDENAWQMLFKNESMPFVIPAGGKIAVKVINDFGDEVMKVYKVS